MLDQLIKTVSAQFSLTDESSATTPLVDQQPSENYLFLTALADSAEFKQLKKYAQRSLKVRAYLEQHPHTDNNPRKKLAEFIESLLSNQPEWYQQLQLAIIDPTAKNSLTDFCRFEPSEVAQTTRQQLLVDLAKRIDTLALLYPFAIYSQWCLANDEEAALKRFQQTVAKLTSAYLYWDENTLAQLRKTVHPLTQSHFFSAGNSVIATGIERFSKVEQPKNDCLIAAENLHLIAAILQSRKFENDTYKSGNRFYDAAVEFFQQILKAIADYTKNHIKLEIDLNIAITEASKNILLKCIQTTHTTPLDYEYIAQIYREAANSFKKAYNSFDKHLTRHPDLTPEIKEKIAKVLGYYFDLLRLSLILLDITLDKHSKEKRKLTRHDLKQIHEIMADMSAQNQFVFEQQDRFFNGMAVYLDTHKLWISMIAKTETEAVEKAQALASKTCYVRRTKPAQALLLTEKLPLTEHFRTYRLDLENEELQHLITTNTYLCNLDALQTVCETKLAGITSPIERRLEAIFITQCSIAETAFSWRKWNSFLGEFAHIHYSHKTLDWLDTLPQESEKRMQWRRGRMITQNVVIFLQFIFATIYTGDYDMTLFTSILDPVNQKYEPYYRDICKEEYYVLTIEFLRQYYKMGYQEFQSSTILGYLELQLKPTGHKKMASHHTVMSVINWATEALIQHRQHMVATHSSILKKLGIYDHYTSVVAASNRQKNAVADKHYQELLTELEQEEKDRIASSQASMKTRKHLFHQLRQQKTLDKFKLHPKPPQEEKTPAASPEQTRYRAAGYKRQGHPNLVELIAEYDAICKPALAPDADNESVDQFYVAAALIEIADCRLELALIATPDNFCEAEPSALSQMFLHYTQAIQHAEKARDYFMQRVSPRADEYRQTGKANDFDQLSKYIGEKLTEATNQFDFIKKEYKAISDIAQKQVRIEDENRLAAMKRKGKEKWYANPAPSHYYSDLRTQRIAVIERCEKSLTIIEKLSKKAAPVKEDMLYLAGKTALPILLTTVPDEDQVSLCAQNTALNGQGNFFNRLDCLSRCKKMLERHQDLTSILLTLSVDKTKLQQALMPVEQAPTYRLG